MHWDYSVPFNLEGWPNEEYQRTASGLLVHAPELLPHEISHADIANGLASESRHCGQLKQWVSVGQHCIGVHDLMQADGYDEETCFAGLMHDCEEYLMKDIPRPLKYRSFMKEYREAQKELRRRIMEKYDVRWGEDTQAEVRKYDELWLNNEKFHFKPQATDDLGVGEVGVPERVIIIPPMGFRVARSIFLARFTYYRPGGVA